MLRLLASFILTVLVSIPAASQTLRDVLLEAQRSNWIVRASSELDSVGPGRILTVTSDSVRIASSTLALESIAQIERRVRSGSGGSSAAFAGAMGMGLIGLGFIAAFCSGDCSLVQLAGGAAMGATLGGTLGGLIGGAATPGRREWVRIWPRE